MFSHPLSDVWEPIDMRSNTDWSRLAWSSLIGIALVSLLSSCDPGFDYRPANWPSTSEHLVWAKDFGDFRIKTSRLAGLLGGSSVTFGFEVTNLAEQPLVLERAELRSATRAFIGNLPGKGAVHWRTVAAGASRHVSVSWRLEKAAPQLLGRHPSIALVFRIGDKQIPVEIVYNLFHAGKVGPD